MGKLSKTTLVSKSAVGSPVTRWISVRPRWSWSSDAARPAWICSNSALSEAAGSSRTRTGTVLMSMPIIESAPASSAGRPLTVEPNTTSSRPVSEPTRMAQIPWHTVLSRTWLLRAYAVSSAVVSDGSSTATSSGGGPLGESAEATNVGSLTPSRAIAQCRSAPTRSCRATHAR